MNNSSAIKPISMFLKTSVTILMTAILLSGCGGDDGDSDFTAEDGEYGIGNDNVTGGYFEVIDNQLYNLILYMNNPISYGSCPTLWSGSVTRPNESEPFMEYANTLEADPAQKIIYYGPIPIDDDRRINIEESSTLISCTQAFTISGRFQDRTSIEGTWKYTIDGQSTNGSWRANLLPSYSPNVFSLGTAFIVIDGDRSDWQGIQPMIADPEGDENTDFDGTDINSVYLAKDNDFLYMMITWHDADPPADSNLFYSLRFNKYSLRGAGVPGDRTAGVFLYYPPDVGMLVSLSEIVISASGAEEIATYNSDYAAVGNKFLEFKVPLSDIGSVDGSYLDVGVRMQDKDEDGLELYEFSDLGNEIVQIEEPN